VPPQKCADSQNSVRCQSAIPLSDPLDYRHHHHRYLRDLAYSAPVTTRKNIGALQMSQKAKMYLKICFDSEKIKNVLSCRLKAAGVPGGD